MYLLDTNIVSELRRVRPHGGVLAWLHSVDDATLHISAVTIGEIQAGIERTRETDGAKAEEIGLWLDQVANLYNIVPMDAQIFRVWAKLMHGRSETVYEDAMIAATASVHNLSIVTRNVADFVPFALPMLNPFE